MSTLEDLGEFGLIERIRSFFPASGEVLEGIGDDCAVVKVGEERVLIACDLFIEGRHFRREFASAEDIGWKAAVSTLSDIAAMGGSPLFGVVSFAAPMDTETELVEGIARGMAAAMGEWGAAIVGGDTARLDGGIVIDVTVVGAPSGERYVTRKGAAAGDALVVTGPLGLASAGLHALKEGHSAPSLVEAHVRPKARIKEGQWFASRAEAHAMIDISDGLVQDAGHLAAAADLGVDVVADGILFDRELEGYCTEQGLDAQSFFFSGGEDYELAVAVRGDACEAVREDFRETFGRELIRIGTFTRDWKGLRVGGEAVESGGFDHFRN